MLLLHRLYVNTDWDDVDGRPVCRIRTENLANSLSKLIRPPLFFRFSSFPHIGKPFDSISEYEPSCHDSSGNADSLAGIRDVMSPIFASAYILYVISAATLSSIEEKSFV